jgi:nucleotide-binding universal stress UspA family protein
MAGGDEALSAKAPKGDTASAKGCDLIVMGSHGRRGIAGLLLTQKTLTHSTIPVLVYRE